MEVNRQPGSGFQLVIAGAAGQGLQTIETILTRLFKGAGYHVFATSSRGSSRRRELVATLT